MYRVTTREAMIPRTEPEQLRAPSQLPITAAGRLPWISRKETESFRPPGPQLIAPPLWGQGESMLGGNSCLCALHEALPCKENTRDYRPWLFHILCETSNRACASEARQQEQERGVLDSPTVIRVPPSIKNNSDIRKE